MLLANPRYVRFCVWAFLLTPMLTAAAVAGMPRRVFIRDDGDKQTTLDDRAVITNLRWYDGANVQWYYVQSEFGDKDIVPNSFNTFYDLTNDQVAPAMQRALDAWNGARFADFRFKDIIASNLHIQLNNPLGLRPREIAIDGFNLISFRSAVIPDAGLVSSSVMSYFTHDVDLHRIQQGVPIDVINVVINEVQAGGEALAVIDLDQNGVPELYIPFQKYKGGEIFDVDIVYNMPAIEPFLYAWPEDIGDVPGPGEDVLGRDEASLAGSLDVQAILTYELGRARGIANSMLFDAVMFPFWEPPDAAFPANPYKRRILAFDDELAVAAADGEDPGGGSIFGQVIEGSEIDGFQDEDQGTDVGVTDLYVTQAPVFLAAQPEFIQQTSLLNSGAPEFIAGTGVQHPDNILSQPIDSNTPNRGIYRKVAYTLSGRELVVATGAGLAELFVPLPDPQDGIDPGEQPGGSGIGGEVDGEAVLLTDNEFNGAFSFPGLPTVSDEGTPIDYALYIEDDILVAPDIVQAYFAGTETFPPEFYGGPVAAIQAGTGQVFEVVNTANDRFGNGYWTAQVNAAGRFAFEIVQGSEMLSGEGQDPRSYIRLNGNGMSYSNRNGLIGAPETGVIIDDVAINAKGTWARSGEFRLGMFIRATTQGGIEGVPHGMEVTYQVTNLSDSRSTFSLTQVLDTFVLWHRESCLHGQRRVVPQ